MGFLLITGLVLFAAAMVMLSAQRQSAARRRERAQVLERLATELPGLSLRRGPWLGRDGLRGQVDGVNLLIEPESHAAGQTVELGAWGNVDHDLSIAARHAWEPVARLLAVDQPAWESGDPAFDAEVAVRGPQLTLCAGLDAHTRQAWCSLAQRKGQLQQGVGRLSFEGVLVEDRLGRSEVARSDVLAGARLLVDGVRRFNVPPRDVPRAIARNALRDPVASVRLKNLNTLAEYFPNKPITRTLAHAALRDAEPAVRVAAALICLDDDARRMMRRQVAMEEVSGPLRAAALRALDKLGPVDAIASARASLGPVPTELRVAAIEVLGAREDAQSLGALCALAGQEALAEACARALYALGDPRAESALLEILSRAPVPARVVAARALGTLGTLRAVAPLLEHAQGLLTDGELKEACRSSVRAIQARVPDADAGRLTIAQPADEGGLSLSQDDGAVSLVPPKGKTR